MHIICMPSVTVWVNINSTINAVNGRYCSVLSADTANKGFKLHVHVLRIVYFIEVQDSMSKSNAKGQIQISN